jgi:hypothetical protein
MLGAGVYAPDAPPQQRSGTSRLAGSRRRAGPARRPHYGEQALFIIGREGRFTGGRVIPARGGSLSPRSPRQGPRGTRRIHPLWPEDRSPRLRRDVS